MFCKQRVFKAGTLAMSVVAALLSSGVSAQDDTITRADLDKLEQKYRSEGDSLREEIGGVKRDSFARTDQTAEKLREE
ncbi:TPA: YadA C-terminal domain-containing protein, partial [Escherichia coli]